MPYQTGSATDPTDLLHQLVTWLQGLGWTTDRDAAEGSGWTFSGHKNGNYVHMRAMVNESPAWVSAFGVTNYQLGMYLGTGFNAGNLWNAQPGGPQGSSSNAIGVGMHLSAGPFSNYYFFADATADNIAVVVEKTPGLYVHIGWGLSLVKSGTYTGGAYFFGSQSGYYSSYSFAGPNTPGFTSSSDCPFALYDQIGAAPGFVRVDVDSFTGKWISIWNTTSGADQGWQGKQGLSSTPTTSAGANPNNFPAYKQNSSPTFYDLSQNLVSQLDGRANLLPLMLWVNRDGTATGFSLIGVPPFIFYSNAVGSGFTAAAEYVIGPTTYKLFPNFAVVKQ